MILGGGERAEEGSEIWHGKHVEGLVSGRKGGFCFKKSRIQNAIGLYHLFGFAASLPCPPLGLQENIYSKKSFKTLVSIEVNFPILCSIFVCVCS